MVYFVRCYQLVYILLYILVYVILSFHFHFYLFCWNINISNVYSAGNFDWNYWRDTMVRFNYKEEFYLTCHILWDHNPCPIGRTIRILCWYLQVFLDQCFLIYHKTLLCIVALFKTELTFWEDIVKEKLVSCSYTPFSNSSEIIN